MTPVQFIEISKTFGPWFATTIVLAIVIIWLGKIVLKDLKTSIENIAAAVSSNTNTLERIAMFLEMQSTWRKKRDTDQ
jgi:hypothetical protein